MPVITIEAAKLNKEQKVRMSQEMTKIAAEVMQLPEQTIYVFIKENELDNIGIGGTLLSDKK